MRLLSDFISIIFTFIRRRRRITLAFWLFGFDDNNVIIAGVSGVFHFLMFILLKKKGLKKRRNIECAFDGMAFGRAGG